MSPHAAPGPIAGFSVVNGAASAVPGWTSTGIDLLWIVVQLRLLFVWLAANSR
ncbi:membrane protein, partial [Xanthomonas vasicola pv. musacearum NCPPB 4384]